MSQSANHLYEFGPFRLNPAERLLLRDGEPAPLPPKVFEILLLLVRSHGRLLKKGEMIAAIWPDAYVEEGNLTHYISDLRKALGESRGDHSYIETVPRIGYRFVAEVREWHDKGDRLPEVEKEGSVVQADTGARENQPARRQLASRLILAAGVILSALAVTQWYFGRASQPRQAQPAPAVKSIAVLPFKPLVVEGRDESFEMGMADSLIMKLSGIRELIVRPARAVRKYTALDQDAVAAGRELMVEAVLDGSVQWSGERVRVTVRLLSVSNGATLWTYQCDEYCTNVFVAQDAISEKVAKALAPVLSSEERRQLAKRPTINNEAYHFYLKGNHHLYLYTQADREKALSYFQQAITLDPNYALAHAGIAKVYADMSGGDYLRPVEAMPKAKQAAERALAADETLAEAHYAMAMVKWWGDWDWPGAEREFRRALALNHNFVTASSYYSRFLSRAGRFAEALREAERAEQLDPLSLPVSSEIISVLYLMRQYDLAIEKCRNTLELHPSDVGRRVVHQSLGDIFIQKQMYQEAIAEWRQAIAFDRSNRNLGRLGYAYAKAGQKAEAQQILQELEDQVTRRRASAVHIARIYVGLGNKDRALDWLRKGYDERSDHVLSLGVDPVYDGLRTDPRFVEMLRGIGLASL